MNSMKNKIIKRTSFIVVIIILIVFVSTGVFYLNSKNDIEYILKTVDYSYLPLEAQNYIKEVYENTGELILTEKNKKEDYPYLNPEYVEYLETGEASEFGYVPEEVLVEHSYINDSISDKQESSGVDKLSSLSYYNLREQGYITNVYNQGSEGLCWAFAGSTSLESHLAIKSNKQTMLTFSEKQIDYSTTLNGALDAGNNPYITRYTNILGSSLNQGGNMLRYLNSTAIGISPMECKGNCSYGSYYNKDNSIEDDKYWKYDYNIKSTLSPYEVFNIDNTRYSLNEVLFFNPLVNQNTTEVNSLVKLLKEQIVNNGSLYVSVSTNDNFSIEYTPTDGEQAINPNGKNLIYYLPYELDSSNALNHAVSIIGWDDDYTHQICLDKTANEITNTIKKVNGTNSCSSSSASLYTIKGAWILQNSWGANNKPYIYLPYNTMKSSYKSISSVEEIDFDNSYRATGTKTYIDKGNTKEIVSKVKLFISAYNQTIKVYYNKTDNNIIINDGSKTSSGILLKTLKITYPGLYTINLLDKNIILDENVSRAIFSFDTNDTDYYYYASLHTNDVENTKYIDINKISKVDEEILAKCTLDDNKCISTPQKITFDDNNVFIISGITRNLTSSDNLTFKVLNYNKEDVTNLFHFFRNFSVSNYVNTLMSYNDNNVPLDNYTIEVYYNGVKYDELEWKLRKHNNIMDGIGTKDNPHIIKSILDLNDVRNHTINNIIYGYYVLDNDLDLTYNTQNKQGLFYNSGSGWHPFYKFAGNFDGQNHVISGLYINRPSYPNEVGLFGAVYGGDNYISNIIFKDVNITGYNNVGALIGGIYEADGIRINNIAIINGSVVSSVDNLGSIVGKIEVKEDSSYTFYNLFNNAKVGQSNSKFTGGFIGLVDRTESYEPKYNFTILDSVNLGNVYGGNGNTGGLIGEISNSNRLIFKNIISVGTYKNSKPSLIGDIFGIGYNNLTLNMSNIYYVNNLYGTDFKITDQTGITNNTKVEFRDIVTNNAINSFVYKSKWIYPEIDGIKRIPMLKTMVDYFDFTSKIDDFNLDLNSNINIYDFINPKINEVKNIKYTYDKEYLTIDSDGMITPKKLGVTTIQINSLYDGYEDNIQVIIGDTTNIVYNSNNDIDETIVQEVASGESISLNKNSFKYEGYVFDGWNTKEDGSGDNYIDEQFIEEGINEELHLYAQWKLKEYTVTFNSNDGSDTVQTQLIKHNIGTKLNKNSFSRNTYIFNGWNTKEDGSGNSYTDEQLITITDSLILYAQWVREEIKVTFDANGGIGIMSEQIFTYDISQKITKNKYTKEGYKFKEWNTLSDGTGKSYSDGLEIKLNNDLILYAIWEETYSYIINKYSYDDNKMYIDGIGINTTINDFKKNIILNTDYSIYVDNKYVDGKYILYTGGKSRIYKNNDLYVEYTNIIRGDINGDGVVNSADLLKIRQHLLKINVLSDIYYLSSDINYDNTINSADLLRVRQHLLGTKTIE